jgi:hypothetical protein
MMNFNNGSQNDFNGQAVNPYVGQEQMGFGNMPYNQGGIPLPNGQEFQVTHVNVDVAEIMRVIMEGMNRMVININQSRNTPKSMLVEAQQNISPSFDNSEFWIGIYGSNGYGVFNDESIFSDALKFVKDKQYGYFADYYEALNYAKLGVSRLSGIPLEGLPENTKVNWIEYLEK